MVLLEVPFVCGVEECRFNSSTFKPLMWAPTRFYDSWNSHPRHEERRSVCVRVCVCVCVSMCVCACVHQSVLGLVKVIEGGIRGWVRVEIMRGQKGEQTLYEGKYSHQSPQPGATQQSVSQLSAQQQTHLNSNYTQSLLEYSNRNSFIMGIRAIVFSPFLRFRFPGWRAAEAYTGRTFRICDRQLITLTQGTKERG